MIHWPTIPTLVLSPVIVWAYLRLPAREENAMIERFGDAYVEYRGRVPAVSRAPAERWNSRRRSVCLR